MIRSISVALFCLLILSAFKTGYWGSVNIRYDFESVDISSGPDTFELFESGTSEVSLSSQYAFRGAYSLHIQDWVKNLSFPEFQGYFPEISEGVIEIGFAMMTPTPQEPFNIALAGDAHFSMTQNGIGFWLLNDSGTLRHMSDSIPKRLFEIEAFKWYWVEASLDITKGEYALLIRDESGQELVSIEGQQHPSSAKKSNLSKYSFAGDLEDLGNANLYIDEFVLSTDYADTPRELMAPGRRSLFVDKWDEYHKKVENLDFCLPPKLPYDFLSIYNAEGMKTLQKHVESLRFLLRTPTQQGLAKFRHKDDVIVGVAKWAEGCLFLKSGHYEDAVKALEISDRILGAPASQMGLAIAYAKLSNFQVAQSYVVQGRLTWPEDIRWLIISAGVGFMSGNLQDSESVLAAASRSLRLGDKQSLQLMSNFGWLNEPAIENLKGSLVWNEGAQSFVVAEQYYYSLLWQKHYGEAEDYAREFSRLLSQYDFFSPLWSERIGDAALLAHRLISAEAAYKIALKSERKRMSSLQKLADVYFLQGRVDDERQQRESIFGALNYE